MENTIEIAELLVPLQLRLRSDTELAELFMSGSQVTVTDLHTYIEHFVAHLRESVLFDNRRIIQKYVNWQTAALDSRGLAHSGFSNVVSRTRDVITQHVDTTIAPEVTAVLSKVSVIEVEKKAAYGSYIDLANRFGKIAHELMRLLLAKNRKEAVQLIHDAIDDGTSIEDIYLNVIHIVLAETGRLWQNNKLSVLQEHYITAVCQMIMSQLFSHFVKVSPGEKRILACSIGDELHEIGIRMVADLFELNGWDSYYAGANTPSSEIVASVSENMPHLLAISATGMQYFSKVKETIDAIKASDYSDSVTIMVGGRGFNSLPEMSEKVGADLYSSGFHQALTMANERVG